MRLQTVLPLLALFVIAPARAQAPALAPPDARISDAVIHADLQVYAATQARLQALNERGLGRGPRVSDYHYAKAQCWLDVSFHEYTRNDRSPFPQEALEQSARLIVAMERSEALPDDTPLVNDAARLRPDLWEAVARQKSQASARCAAALLACAEVELVHAGNEYQQLGWRHAAPYVQIAEDRVREAQAAQCAPLAPRAAASGDVVEPVDATRVAVQK